jgi:mannose-6-phosphate isomerase-like protein (cupin superfamily)
VILWGACLIQRGPHQVHHWHNDLESFSDRNYVSIWIGLKKTDSDTSLKVIPGSHLIPKPIRQFAHEEGVSAQDIQDDKVTQWSKEHLADSRIDHLDTMNGDALIFDGRLWHGSSNRSRFKKRYALLLQYTRPSTPVRIPNFSYHHWPIDFYRSPNPPCLIVRGSDKISTNDTMPGPPAESNKTKFSISTLIEPLNVTPGILGDKFMDSFHIADGPTPELRSMEIHYSVLNVGQTPHTPHVHKEEEILIIVSGEAELIVEDAKGSNKLERHPVKPGDFIYYPAYWRHTLENTSKEEVVYLMFKWDSEYSDSTDSLESVLVNSSATVETIGRNTKDFEANILLEGKTSYLRKLHSHASVVQPGGGYDPHADSYDVAILLLEGEVVTLNETVNAPAFIYYAGGVKHGLRGSGDKPAKYIVFEFHGNHRDIFEPPRLKRRRQIKEAITNPGLLLKHLSWRLGQYLKK